MWEEPPEAYFTSPLKGEVRVKFHPPWGRTVDKTWRLLPLQV